MFFMLLLFAYRGGEPPEIVANPDLNPDRTLKAFGQKVLSRKECEENFKKDFGYETWNDPMRGKFLIENGFYRMYLKNYEICTKGGEKSACSEDSGGPLICEGIFTIECNKKMNPSLTNLDSFHIFPVFFYSFTVTKYSSLSNNRAGCNKRACWKNFSNLRDSNRKVF